MGARASHVKMIVLLPFLAFVLRLGIPGRVPAGSAGLLGLF
jgi:hypothetical protein